MCSSRLQQLTITTSHTCLVTGRPLSTTWPSHRPDPTHQIDEIVRIPIRCARFQSVIKVDRNLEAVLFCSKATTRTDPISFTFITHHHVPSSGPDHARASSGCGRCSCASHVSCCRHTIQLDSRHDWQHPCRPPQSHCEGISLFPAFFFVWVAVYASAADHMVV